MLGAVEKPLWVKHFGVGPVLPMDAVRSPQEIRPAGMRYGPKAVSLTATRSKNGTAGYSRIDSDQTARGVRRVVEQKPLAGSDFASSYRRCCTSAWRAKSEKAKETAVAVVSCPAIIIVIT